MKSSEFSLVFIQGPDGNPRVGFTKDSIQLKSIEDATRLYKLQEFASKMEDKAARDARVLKSQLVLFEQAGEEKEQPHQQFHKQVIDNSANLEVLKTNMEAISACNAKENLDILARNLFLKYGEKVKDCLERQVIEAAKNSVSYKSSLKSYFNQDKIPEWIGRKMLSPLNPKPTSALRLLFPKDGNKGVTLTVEEWEDDEIVNSFGPLMGYSKIIKTMSLDMKAFFDEGVQEIDKSRILESLRIPVLPVVPLTILGGFRRVPSSFKFEKMILLERLVNAMMDIARVIFPPKERYAKALLAAIFTDSTYNPLKTESPLSQILDKPDQKVKFPKIFADTGEILRVVSMFNFPIGEFNFLRDVLQKNARITLSQDEEKEILGPDYFPGAGQKCQVVTYYPDSMNSQVLKPTVSPTLEAFQNFKRTPNAAALETQKRRVNQSVRNTLYGKYATDLMKFLSKPQNPYAYIRDDVEQFLNQFVIGEFRETAAQALLATFMSKVVPKATEYYDPEQHDFVVKHEDLIGTSEGFIEELAINAEVLD